MAWTVFTTTFLWTPTMRGLFKPEISSWVVMGIRGTGREGAFWVFPALALLALFAFYLEGRGRWRPLFHILLIGWHTTVTGIVVYGAAVQGTGAYFEGAMWGVRVPLLAVAVPFVAFFALAIRWVLRERRAPGRPEPARWGAVHWSTLGLAGLLLPVAIVLFRLGEGIDWTTRLATAATILQWILLTQALSHRPALSGRPRHAGL
jgi:hypothetical protein